MKYLSKNNKEYISCLKLFYSTSYVIYIYISNVIRPTLTFMSRTCWKVFIFYYNFNLTFRNFHIVEETNVSVLAKTSNEKRNFFKVLVTQAFLFFFPTFNTPNPGRFINFHCFSRTVCRFLSVVRWNNNMSTGSWH